MMRKKCEEYLQKLHADLHEVESSKSTPIKSLKYYHTLVSNSLEKIKLMILDEQFDTEIEEIEFFKFLKPQFSGLMIFASERYSYQSNKPLITDQLPAYAEEQLKFINRLFRQHEFFYQYYRLGATEMDSIYFLRGRKPSDLINLDFPDVDPTFATAGDYLFAKFFAYEKLQEYILNDTKKPITIDDNPILTNRDTLNFKWTGDKTNLVEVIYGLFYTGQLNSGNATLSDIIKWMEQILQIDLSRSYRNFIDIRNRKRDSPTKFLDKMREFIIQKIEDDNAFKPSK